MASSLKIILHADDFGLSPSFNAGILKAFQSGYLTSTCLRTNGSAFEEAVRLAKEHPGLGMGVHLNVVEGKSRRSVGKDEILCDGDGRYRRRFVSLVGALFGLQRRKLLAEIEADFRDQIETVIARGIRPDHLNSHQHCNVIPALFDVTCKLAKEYGIPFVRLPREKFFLYKKPHNYILEWRWYVPNLIKHFLLNALSGRNLKIAQRHNVQTNDIFLGLLYTGKMDVEIIKSGLLKIEGSGQIKTVEVLLHPAMLVASRNENFIVSYLREYVVDFARWRETQALMDPALFDFLKEKGFELTNFSFLASGNKASGYGKKAPSQGQAQRVSVFLVVDENPFYQPDYVNWLVTEARDFHVCAAAIVKFRMGGILQEHLLRNIRQLGLGQAFLLAFKNLLLSSQDYFQPLSLNKSYGSVEKVCKDHGIPFKKVTSPKDIELLAYMKSYQPDIVLSSTSFIFSEDMIRVPRLAFLNRHSAALPSYGGILPVFRAIQFKEKFTGASVHHVVREVDKGEVIARKYIPIFKKDTLDALYRLCFIASF